MNVEAIRKAMSERGFSQARLARRLGVNRSTVNRWLTGERTLDPSAAATVATLLGVELGDAPTHEPTVRTVRELRQRVADLEAAFEERSAECERLRREMADLSARHEALRAGITRLAELGR
ncbi:helix-turn-helix transcriptional regulator [Polyangium sp. 15x6]|uniref:helix-turn-helix domain-containing protein n=1 Tax=Polyangium sp. 15x6 TaxID=3042687 RepID=UPI00249A8195|nr:helix-turn-helix transcriptional regulator [Polyangium sp. 15x6]MDI3285154.1 helix-turn-helix transcriptional regulator [Polyangium sp. 15x6]